MQSSLGSAEEKLGVRSSRRPLGDGLEEVRRGRRMVWSRTASGKVQKQPITLGKHGSPVVEMLARTDAFSHGRGELVKRGGYGVVEGNVG